jgi:hypothetical protein
MSEFVQLGDFDGVSVSYTTAAPRPKVEPVPEPEIPAHVMANYLFNHELEAAYYKESRKFRRAQANSSIAFKKFYSTDFKGRETLRREYFEELSEAVAGIEAVLPKSAAKAVNKYPWMRDVGCSIVSPRSKNGRTILADE